MVLDLLDSTPDLLVIGTDPGILESSSKYSKEKNSYCFTTSL
jgi:hypothetical protein